ncbi:hypothetical protein GFS31_11440 [Leptolyngbya sp. BL0902]|nr:hypothetical protein GFS31_11440 [Leptolyngbya sp. BL0902]
MITQLGGGKPRHNSYPWRQVDSGTGETTDKRPLHPES